MCGTNLPLAVAFILFIYAVTSGSADGWATAEVLTPFIISVLLIIGFFYWETQIPFKNATMYVIPSYIRVHALIVCRNRPPSIWFYNNFCVLFGSALLPFLWWNALFIVFATLWQDIFHWTVVSTAAHM